MTGQPVKRSRVSHCSIRREHRYCKQGLSLELERPYRVRSRVITTERVTMPRVADGHWGSTQRVNDDTSPQRIPFIPRTKSSLPIAPRAKPKPPDVTRRTLGLIRVGLQSSSMIVGVRMRGRGAANLPDSIGGPIADSSDLGWWTSKPATLTVLTRFGLRYASAHCGAEYPRWGCR